MKRWIAYFGVLAAALALEPSSGTDIAKLQPVQAVYLYIEDGALIIQTDTGDVGRGRNLDGAFADLKQTTAGTVFLDTADYLIVTETTAELIPGLYDDLRPACIICIGETKIDLEMAVGYLTAHEPKSTLKDHRAGQTELPRLRTEEGRMYLVEAEDE